MPESLNAEYRSYWTDECLEWICGYANAQGGKMYIGLDDDGNATGLPDASKLADDIPGMVRDAMGIFVGIKLREQDGREYIETDVPPYPVCISCKGIFYFHNGRTNQALTGPGLEAFFMQKRGATWDNLPYPAFKMADIDSKALSQFRKLASKAKRIGNDLLEEPDEVLLDRLHLKNGSYLTNAAMLLFSSDPERYQLGAYIKIGYFGNDAELLYHDEIHGSVLEQADKAVELILLKYMKAKITYEGIQRIERYFVPEEALREALLTAVCHKHYESGIPVQVSVYEDRLYVAYAGSLPECLTLESIRQKTAPKPCNPNVAQVLFLAGFIKSWGCDTEHINNLLKADNLPLPEYTVHQGDVMIQFTGPEDRIIRMRPVSK